MSEGDGGTQPGILLVMANVEKGRHAEFNEWYDTRHLDETLAIHPAFESGRRFIRDDARKMTRDAPDAPFQYMTLYEVADIVDADAALFRVARTERAADIAAGRAPRHVKHEAMSADLRTWWYAPVNGRVGAKIDPLVGDRQLLLVFSNAAEGRHEEFNEWYSSHHLAEILAVDPCFLSAQRYRRADLSMTIDSRDAPYEYLAVYDVSDARVADEALHELARVERREALEAGRTPRLVMSPSMHPELRTWWFQPTGRVVARSSA